MLQREEDQEQQRVGAEPAGVPADTRGKGGVLEPRRQWTHEAKAVPRLTSGTKEMINPAHSTYIPTCHLFVRASCSA